MMATLMTEHGRKRALLWYRLGIPLEVRWLRCNWREDAWGPFKHDWYPVIQGGSVATANMAGKLPFPVAIRTVRGSQA